MKINTFLFIALFGGYPSRGEGALLRAPTARKDGGPFLDGKEDASSSGTARRLADFVALDDTLEALREKDPVAANLVDKYHPVFDFDGDGCLPAAAISRLGKQNSGTSLGGGVGDGCRGNDFLIWSNTYHRYDRVDAGGSTYEAHIFDLYFEKDQVVGIIGHVHDIETVIMFFKNNEPWLVGVSQHGDYQVAIWSMTPKTVDGHPKVVYHKDDGLTHAFRFAENNEKAENQYGEFVMPPLASWFEMTGESGAVSNAYMRYQLNNFVWGSPDSKVIDKFAKREVDRIREAYAFYHIPKFPFETPKDVPVFDPYAMFSGTWTRETTDGAPPVSCGANPVSGFKCRGHYCDNVSMKCADAAFSGLSVQNEYHTNWFSNGSGKKCADGYFVTGIRCEEDGDYCDTISLTCSKLGVNGQHPLIRRECLWTTESLSEEYGGVSEFTPSLYLAGMYCGGNKHCDNKKFYLCSASDDPALDLPENGGGEDVTLEEGMFGTWEETFKGITTADLYVCGAMIRFEGKQGGGDDTAANGLRFRYCHKSDWYSNETYEIHAGKWGAWPESYTMCPTGHYVDGAQVRSEAYQGGRDDTMLNGLRLRCTSMTNNGVHSWIVVHPGLWGDWTSCHRPQGGGEKRRKKKKKIPSEARLY